ncbi:MAG: hypothetical protein ACRDYA_11060 [Egibacteraceae bacterium]
MRARRLVRRSRLALYAMATLTVVGVPAYPVSADPSCPGGTICFWTEEAFEGSKIVVDNPQPDRSCRLLPAPAASVKNATSGLVVLLGPDPRCEGDADIIEPGGDDFVIAPAARSFALEPY